MSWFGESTGRAESPNKDEAEFGTPEAGTGKGSADGGQERKKRLTAAKTAAKTKVGSEQASGSSGPQGLGGSTVFGGDLFGSASVELPIRAEEGESEAELSEGHTTEITERLKKMEIRSDGGQDVNGSGEQQGNGSGPGTPRVSTRYAGGSPAGSPSRDQELFSLRSEVGQLRVVMERMFEERRQSEEFMKMMIDEKRRAEDRDERRREQEERQRDADREVEYERVRVLAEVVDTAKHRKDPEVGKIEVIRTTKSEVMKLLPPSEPKPAVRAGNWLARLDVTIGEQSDTAGTWFKEIRSAAEEAYSRYQKAIPLDRLEVEPKLEDSDKWARLRARVTDMLLESLPAVIAEELVSTRKLHPTSILFRVLVLYAPGGVAERSQLLTSLVELEEVVNPQQGLTILRDWNSDMDRAEKWIL
jgi:hypothetical protein